MKFNYTHYVTGEEITLLETFDSHGEMWVVYEDADNEMHQCDLLDFNEMLSEEVTLQSLKP